MFFLGLFAQSCICTVLNEMGKMLVKPVNYFTSIVGHHTVSCRAKHKIFNPYAAGGLFGQQVMMAKS